MKTPLVLAIYQITKEPNNQRTNKPKEPTNQRTKMTSQPSSRHPSCLCTDTQHGQIKYDPLDPKNAGIPISGAGFSQEVISCFCECERCLCWQRRQYPRTICVLDPCHKHIVTVDQRLEPFAMVSKSASTGKPTIDFSFHLLLLFLIKQLESISDMNAVLELRSRMNVIQDALILEHGPIETQLIDGYYDPKDPESFSDRNRIIIPNCESYPFSSIPDRFIILNPFVIVKRGEEDKLGISFHLFLPHIIKQLQDIQNMEMIKELQRELNKMHEEVTPFDDITQTSIPKDSNEYMAHESVHYSPFSGEFVHSYKGLFSRDTYVITPWCIGILPPLPNPTLFETLLPRVCVDI